MVWALIQQFGTQASHLLVFVMLALLLTPKDFGILAMITAWTTFIAGFSEMGFGSALIQRQDIGSEHFSSIFFLNIGVGIILTLFGVALSWPCALFFKTPDIQPVMSILSFGFILNSFSFAQRAIARKEMRFRDLAIRDVSAALIGGGAGIALAYSEFGVWSLVVQSLVTSFFGAVLLWKLSQWRPSLAESSLQCVKDLWPYSSKLFAFNIFKYFAQNSDKLLIGYFIGPTAVGLYDFAYKMIVFPVNHFALAIGNYLFPKFSRMQNDLESVRSSHLFVAKATNSIVMPLMALAVLSSPLVIPLVFGQKWAPAISLAQIMAAVAIAQALISPIGQLMKALNHPGWFFWWSVVFTLIISCFIWIGASYGIIGVALGLAASHVVGLLISLWISTRLVKTHFREIINVLWPSTVLSILMLLLSFALSNFEMLGNYYGLFAILILSVIFYSFGLRYLDSDFLEKILGRFRFVRTEMS